MYDVTQSYDATFYTAGACLIASGVLVAFRDKAKGHKNVLELQCRPAANVDNPLDLPEMSSRQSKVPIQNGAKDGLEPDISTSCTEIS